MVAKLAELAVRSSSETVVSSSTRFAQVTVPSPITTYARRGMSRPAFGRGKSSFARRSKVQHQGPLMLPISTDASLMMLSS